MIKVGCAGFSIPQTRYFREFSLVEIQETALGVPGEGTLRRWQREAPEGFEFTMLAPRETGASGFKDEKPTRALLGAVLAFGKNLGIRRVVFLSPAEFGSSRPNRAAIRAFFERAPRKGITYIWEPSPGWSAGEAASVGRDCGLVVATDPLTNGRFDEQIAYFRMPGPAGRRSRYEDSALADLAVACQRPKECTCIFGNADMHADGKRLKTLLKIA